MPEFLRRTMPDVIKVNALGARMRMEVFGTHIPPTSKASAVDSDTPSCNAQLRLSSLTHSLAAMLSVCIDPFPRIVKLFKYRGAFLILGADCLMCNVRWGLCTVSSALVWMGWDMMGWHDGSVCFLLPPP